MRDKNRKFSLFDNFINWMIFITSLVLIVIGAVLSVLLFAEVVCRYFFNYSIFFAEELSRVLFIWFGLLGSVLALHEGSHIGFDSIKKKFQGNTAHIIAIITYLVIIFYCSYVFLGCISILPRQRFQVFASLGISLFWSYLSVAVGMALIVIRSLYSFVHELVRKPDNLLSLDEMFHSKVTEEEVITC